MAIISIPNSIGGVAVPGGLLNGPLGALFGKKTGSSNQYQYPQDIGSNPTRSHSVLFTIKDIDPNSLTEQKKTFINNQQQVVSSSLQGVNQAQGFKGTLSAIGGVVGSVVTVAGNVADVTGNLIERTASQGLQATLRPPIGSITDNITLYMPETLNMSYNAQWQEFSLTDTFGGVGRIAAAAMDAYSQKDMGFDEKMKNLAAGPAGLDAAGALLKGDAGSDILLRSGGYAINPQAQLLYKGIGLRNFQLEFLFTPKNASESQTIKTIIDRFTRAFLPTVQGAVKGGASGQYFTMPSIFEIKFQFHGGNQNTAAGAAISSILGSLGSVGAALAPSLTPGSTKGNENNYLYKVGNCVLEDMSVDYAPNGWIAYSDGSPIQTRLTLSFKETDIMHRDIFKDGKGSVR